MSTPVKVLPGLFSAHNLALTKFSLFNLTASGFSLYGSPGLLPARCQSLTRGSWFNPTGSEFVPYWFLPAVSDPLPDANEDPVGFI